MSLDAFRSSDGPEQDSEETFDSEFKNCRTETLSDPSKLDTPEFVSVWISDDGLMAMMEVTPSYFREHVSEDVKDQAKARGLIYLDTTGPDPVIVLTDDPEEYGLLLETFGLKEFLRKRYQGVI